MGATLEKVQVGTLELDSVTVENATIEELNVEQFDGGLEELQDETGGNETDADNDTDVGTDDETGPRASAASITIGDATAETLSLEDLDDESAADDDEMDDDVTEDDGDQPSIAVFELIGTNAAPDASGPPSGYTPQSDFSTPLERPANDLCACTTSRNVRIHGS